MVMKLAMCYISYGMWMHFNIDLSVYQHFETFCSALY
jgi:hypothetical protein